MDDKKNQRDRNIETAKRFIHNLMQPNYEDSLEMVNDDCHLEMPFAHDTPTVVYRKDFEEMFKMGSTMVSRISFTINKVHQMIDPDELIVEFECDGTFMSTGKKYCNRYISYFHFKNGKISVYREYFDPGIVSEAATP